MLSTLLKVFTGPLVGEITSLIKDLRQRQVDEKQIEAEVHKAVLKVYGEVAVEQAKVIETEAKGEDWLQRNWRPISALSFVFILVFYALILPIAVDWLGAPPVRVGDLLLSWVMNIVVIALGGYIGGRSIEKIVKTFKQ